MNIQESTTLFNEANTTYPSFAAESLFKHYYRFFPPSPLVFSSSDESWMYPKSTYFDLRPNVHDALLVLRYALWDFMTIHSKKKKTDVLRLFVRNEGTNVLLKECSTLNTSQANF